MLPQGDHYPGSHYYSLQLTSVHHHGQGFVCFSSADFAVVTVTSNITPSKSHRGFSVVFQPQSVSQELVSVFRSPSELIHCSRCGVWIVSS